MAKKQKGYHILAILGFILSFLGLLSVFGIILCIVALLQIPKTKQKGQGLAIAGVVIGIIMFSSSLLVIAFAFFYFNNYIVMGSGNIVTESFDVSDFSKVSLESQGDIFITQVDDYSLVIETDDNIMQQLTVVVSEDTLVIGKKSQVFQLRPSDSIKIMLSMPELEKISVSGAATIKSVNQINSEKLTLSISGAGESNLDLNVQELNTIISGAAKSILRGKAKVHNIEISGFGEINAFELETEKTDITSSGAGEAELFVTQDLDIQISGAGDIAYKGNPSITQTVSGAGKIRKID